MYHFLGLFRYILAFNQHVVIFFNKGTSLIVNGSLVLIYAKNLEDRVYCFYIVFFFVQIYMTYYFLMQTICTHIKVFK